MGKPQDLCLGLVVTPKAESLQQAILAMQAIPALEVGAPQASRIPVVVETAAREDEELLDRIRSLPSVSDVQVAFAQFMEDS